MSSSEAVRRLPLPSLSDWLFAALIAWLFIAGSGWSTLLADGDTGWHIRTGEYILDNRRLPEADLFSFSRAGERWYAWEWLADVAFAASYRQLGLKGVVLLAGTVIALYLTVLFRYMLWSGANAFIALAVCLLCAGASGIHFLARPHIFTLLLLAVSLWLLERDARKPGRAVWILAPLAALWANLHAGFPALLACLGLQIAGSAVEVIRDTCSLRAAWFRVRRKVALLAVCAAATLANPYGIGLHLHIAGYLQSNWIREAVDEFQSPRFRSESALHFEILLFAGILIVPWLVRNRRIGDALMVLFWSHAALVSVRHVPLYAVAACPVIAAAAGRAWERWARAKSPASVAGTLQDIAAGVTPGFRRNTLWPAALVAALVLLDAPLRWPQDFPEVKFPTALVGRQDRKLAGARVFTSDQWGDYLIYRFHPHQKVFIDGRSDFYGPEIGKLYLRIAYGDPEWRSALARYSFTHVLAPPEWPLASLLRRDPAWRLVEEDRTAVLFERAEAPSS
ncbi:MAG: hypothetical protein ACM3S5_02430 [Rhodospirillales bacterium]